MKTFKITQEQIKEALKNPKVFLEAGKWYIGIYNGRELLFNFSGDYDKDNDPLGYGFNLSNEYIDLDSLGWRLHTFKPATPEQVKEALVNEAKKRGYKAGVTVKRAVNEMKLDIKMDNLVFVKSMNALYMNSVCIFHDGKWAEIVEETELEVTLEEIAEKFGVNKVKIKS